MLVSDKELKTLIQKGRFSLNPCFGGCWSLTVIITGSQALYSCLNPCFGGCWSLTSVYHQLTSVHRKSLNPCFGGCWSLTNEKEIEKELRTLS